MINIKVLLLKEFLIIKNSFLKYFFILFFFPLSLYLFLSIPLSIVIYDMKPIYIVWSSIGICLVSCLYLVYILCFSFCSRNHNSNLMKSTPVLSYEYLLAKYLYAIFIGTLQLIISIIISSSLNADYLTFFNLFKLYIVMIPSILIICNISYLFSRVIVNNIFLNIINLFVFIFISFGFGSFIPLSKFPVYYSNIVQYFPVSSTIVNCQRIISNESILYNLLFVSFFYVIILSFINLLLIDKSISNN